jgi:hypothetical protein
MSRGMLSISIDDLARPTVLLARDIRIIVVLEDALRLFRIDSIKANAIENPAATL